MEEIFLTLLNTSVTAGYLVLAVLLARIVLKKAPKWISCALWGLVGLRLVLPFSIESALSLIPRRQVVSPEILISATPAIDSGISAVDEAVNPVLAQSLAPTPAASANPAQLLTSAAAIIWLCGLAALLLYCLVSYLRLRRSVAEAVKLEKGVKQCAGIAGPFVLGLLRPCVYLPYSVTAEDIPLVLAHERAHIKRGDHVVKPLGFLLLSAYWFNPLMWAAYALLCRDMEFACDEAVLRSGGERIKKRYSAALLNCSAGGARLAPCPLAFGEQSVKPRIKSILNYRRPALWVIVAAVLASSALAVGFLTDPRTSGEEAVVTVDGGAAAQTPAASQTLPPAEALTAESWQLVMPRDGTGTGEYAPPETAQTEGALVDSRIKRPLEELMSACRAAGHSPEIFRSYEAYADAVEEYEQERAASGLSTDELWSIYRSPLKMDLQSGLSVLLLAPEDTAEAAVTDGERQAWYSMLEWLAENGPDYGFIRRFPAEKNEITGGGFNCLFRYVGVDAAKYIAANGLCLEEYVSELSGVPVAPAATPAYAPEGAAGDRIEIKFRDFVLDSDLSAPTMHLDDSPIELTAAVYPLSEGAQITWSSGDDTALEVTPNADGSCTVRPLRAVYGGVKLYAECGGVVGECLFYIIE